MRIYAYQPLLVNQLVDDIAATLGIRRRDLNAVRLTIVAQDPRLDTLFTQVAASKGLVHGHIRLCNDQGQITDCQVGSTVSPLFFVLPHILLTSSSGLPHPFF